MTGARRSSGPVLVGVLLLLAAPGGGFAPPVGDAGAVDAAPAASTVSVGDAGQRSLMALSELQPVLVGGDFDGAKRAFDEARYADSLAAFDGQVGDGGLEVLRPELRFLRAQALLKGGRAAEAGTELAALAERLPLLRSRCWFLAAMALEDQKEFAAAADLFGRVAPESPLHRDALLGEARVQAAIGTPTELDAAAEILKPLGALAPPPSGFGRDLGGEALFSLAQLAGRRGKVKEAAARYRELWLTHPLAQLAEPAGAEAIKLGARPASPAQLVARAELVLAGNHNQQAIEALAPLARQLKLKPGPAPLLACQAHFDLAKALKKQRRHSEALVEFGRVLDSCSTPAVAELRARSLYLAGQSAAVVDPPKAKELFGQLVEGFPRSSFADDALFFAADVAAKNLQDPQTAQRDLQTLVERYPDGDYASEARFRLFWLARQSGSPLEGTRQLKQMVAGAPTGAPREPEPIRRARYWLARTDDERSALAALSAVWPGDYYADLAAGALGNASPQEGLPGSCPVALEAGSLSADPAFRAGVLLLQLGLASAADEELASIDRRAISGPQGKTEPLLLLSLAMTQAGDARTAHAIVKSLLEQPGFALETHSLPQGDALKGEARQFLRLLFEVAYPRAFRPEIEHWAAAAAVPPDLLQGLMREESALDPDALSAAGAIGLCQLMPATGKRTAKLLGLGDVTALQLQDPELNIRLGAAYLGELLKRYGGRQPLAVAAYNAGEAAVDKWLGATKGEPMDAFVEDIPIGETRHYVKRVLTSEAVYRTLWGK